MYKQWKGSVRSQVLIPVAGPQSADGSYFWERENEEETVAWRCWQAGVAVIAVSSGGRKGLTTLGCRRRHGDPTPLEVLLMCRRCAYVCRFRITLFLLPL